MAHVLVVDDSPTIRLTLQSWLEPAGHQVDEAADGVAFVATRLEAAAAMRASAQADRGPSA